MPLWPLIVLLPPLAVTVMGGRSAWVWLSLGIGVAVTSGLIQYVLFQFAQGNTEPAFHSLIITDAVDRTYHDTYYVIANITALGTTLIPAFVVGALLFIKAHPRRAKIDLALFWAVVTLLVLASYAMSYILSGSAMPRRYADYGDAMQSLFTAQAWANWLAMALVVVAAARPVWSWWQSRKAA